MTRIAVAAVSTHAAGAAERIAAQGGNAVDAAIAASIAGMISEPGIVALGGGGFLTIWPPDRSPCTVDGYAIMPGKGTDPSRFGGGMFDAWMAYGGGMTTRVGHGSVAVPGALAACQTASSRFGKLSWRLLVEPSVDLAEHGFPLSVAASRYLEHCHDTIFGWHEPSYGALHDESGKVLEAGDIVRIDGLAESLRAIADFGAEVFYTGSLARKIVADMDAGGGLLTEEDLASYEAIVRDPLRLEILGWDIASNPPPAVGGVALAAMIALMDQEPVGSWTEEALDRLVKVQRSVFGHRREHLDGAEDLAAEAETLLNMIDADGAAWLAACPSTIHTSVVDESGLACAATFSAGYGSGVMAPGTGIWLNNSLGELELNPGGLHALEPGERLLSNMAPTVARDESGSVVAIGSPGAERITTAILQAFLNIAHLGMTLQDAVAHPRIHVEFTNGETRVAYEPGSGVESLGYPTRPFEREDMFFGGVGAVALHPDGTMETGVDPRRSGAAVVT
ncbi:gamma-glutamyltranspeptidase precursor [bacterium BMS3Abin02]|nr:gamma-glutamyltranspeptidase precursor [bacterium BMS3Abin02]GBE21003.1 gamma-glutamyltranspeptidase precursor [bacterium BMS3Bbin01]HDH25921.1 gamma-glutamyltransferase [Actinomycetota bacterium]HDK45554.1 gamma-glutamyltransferase [Actinomycetota bacterium]HDL50184.1 gamma-glutamyltransferase [Actinomycetota bacterium]